MPESELPDALADLLGSLPSAVGAVAVVIVAILGLAFVVGGVLNLLEKESDDEDPPTG